MNIEVLPSTEKYSPATAVRYWASRFASICAAVSVLVMLSDPWLVPRRTSRMAQGRTSGWRRLVAVLTSESTDQTKGVVNVPVARATRDFWPPDSCCIRRPSSTFELNETWQGFGLSEEKAPHAGSSTDLDRDSGVVVDGTLLRVLSFVHFILVLSDPVRRHSSEDKRSTTNLINPALNNESPASCGHELLEHLLEVLRNLLECPLDSLVLALIKHIDELADGVCRLVELRPALLELIALLREVVVLLECFLVDVGELLERLVNLMQFLDELSMVLSAAAQSPHKRACLPGPSSRSYTG